MSGVEAIAAIELVDACIGIMNTIINISHAFGDAPGLPTKLLDLLEKTPTTEGLLENAKRGGCYRRALEISTNLPLSFRQNCVIVIKGAAQPSSEALACF
jgi:hypothetical protein